MNKRPAILVLVAVASVLVGFGYATSGADPDRPLSLPDRNAPTLVAGPDGEALRCAGKLVKLNLSQLGGTLPAKPPTTARERAQAAAPSFDSFSCAVDSRGKQTGGVSVRATKDGMSVLRTVPAAEQE